MASKQPTQEELQMIQAQRNADFMKFSHVSYIPANSQNSDVFAPSKTINFNAPIIAGGYATEITLRVQLTLDVDGTTGALKPTASYPYSFLNRVKILFGNDVQNVHPYIAYINDLLEGYGRQSQSDVLGVRNATIDDMLNKFPKGDLPAGEHKFDFEITLPLNSLHEGSTNGIIPLYSAGTTLQIQASTCQNVVGNDALDNPLFTTGDFTATVKDGSVQIVVGYRDYSSFYTTQSIQPDISGLPAVQVVELPAISNLSQGTVNNVSFRNPYLTAKIFHIVVDGVSPEKFSSAPNITTFAYDKAENSNSSFLRFDESNGGVRNYYKMIRSVVGNDLPEGVLVYDGTIGIPGRNLANVSSKQGVNYMNLVEYPAARFGVKVDKVDTTKTTPRVISFAHILNDKGIQAR